MLDSSLQNCVIVALGSLGLTESTRKLGPHKPFDDWHELLFEPVSHHRFQQVACDIFQGSLFATHREFAHAALLATNCGDLREGGDGGASRGGGHEPLWFIGRRWFNGGVRRSHRLMRPCVWR